MCSPGEFSHGVIGVELKDLARAYDAAHACREDGYGPAMTRVRVEPRTSTEYLVVVEGAAEVTSHRVTVWPSDIERYAPGSTPEALLEAAFTFLLEREPQRSILTRFEVSVIEQYFPDFAQAMGVRLA